MTRIVVTRILTADNTDVLDGTDLANIPGNGVLRIMAASTQNDTTMSITGPGQQPIINNRAIQLRTNGQVLQSDDVPFDIAVRQGGHYVVNIDIVTAATVGIVAAYQGN